MRSTGFVRDETDQARVYLETQKEGYFNNDHLLQQVKHTIDIFERVHPNALGLFLFDNAPSHKKVADDALNVDKMNVHPGGMQPKMRSTTWEGRTQTMVYRDGTPKGMKAVLEERGVDTRNMKAPDMREKLKSNPDFQNATTLLEDLIHRKIGRRPGTITTSRTGNGGLDFIMMATSVPWKRCQVLLGPVRADVQLSHLHKHVCVFLQCTTQARFGLSSQWYLG